LAIGKNCHLLGLGTLLRENIHTFFWVGLAGKEIVAGHLKFFSDYFKFLEEPWDCHYVTLTVIMLPCSSHQQQTCGFYQQQAISPIASRENHACVTGYSP